MTRRRLKARRDRRGRPKKALARRNNTTTVGRRGEPVNDLGTPELLEQRRRVTGSAEFPTDLLGVLAGKGMIAAEEYAAALDVAQMVRIVRHALGLREASCEGPWRAVLSGAPAGGRVLDGTYPGAERARRTLARLARELGRVAWAAVADAIDNLPPPPADFAKFLMDLKGGLRYLSERLVRSRRATG